jgi:endoplasmic reticulum Man9GlcNAc2 1,2-alpha-mannosidase
VCFLPGTLALGATKGVTKKKALENNLLTDEDIENLQLAEDLTKTCVETYFVTSTGLAPEIAYFHNEVIGWWATERISNDTPESDHVTS